MTFTYAGRYNEVFQVNGRTVTSTSESVAVYEAGTSTLATLYTSRTKAATATNPVEVSSGNLAFYAEPGLYDLVYKSQRISGVAVLPDPLESPDTYLAKSARPLNAIDYANGDGSSFDLAALISDMETASRPAYFQRGIDFQPTAPVSLDAAASDFGYVFLSEGAEITLPAGMVDGDGLLDVNSAGTGFRQHPHVVVEGLRVNGGSSPDGAFIVTNQRSVTLRRVIFDGLKYGAITDGYTDLNRLEQVHAINMTTGGWVFDQTDHGDGLVVAGFFTYGGASAGIRLNKNQGAFLTGVIGGSHDFTDSDVTFTGWHVEGNGDTSSRPLIQLRGGNYDFQSGDFYVTKYRPTIDIDDSGGYRRATRLHWNGRAARFKQRLDDPAGEWGSAVGVAVHITDLDSKSELHFDEPRLDLYGHGSGVARNILEARLPTFTSDVTALSDLFAARPALLGENWSLKQRLASYEIDVHGMNGLRSTRRFNTPTLSAAAVAENGYEADLAAGTYYYRAWIRDAELRRTAAAAEVSATTTGGSPLVQLTGNLQGSPAEIFIVRGTSAATYTHWVAIPWGTASYELFDQGSTIAGETWSTVSVPSLPSAGETEDGWVSMNNGRATVYRGGAPTAGTWAKGDLCWNVNVAAAGTPGWICTTAGTPGTWKAMASVAS